MDKHDKILTPTEVAEILRLDEWTVKRFFRSKELPGFKIGGQWRVHQSTLDEWIKQRYGQLAEQQ